LHVEQRTAGVAGGDRGVGLDEVHQGLRLARRAGDLAVQPGDDACGDRVLEAKGAADGEGSFARLGQVAPVLRHGQVLAVGAHDGEVGDGVGGQDGAW
jgi:hypothetical protein